MKFWLAIKRIVLSLILSCWPSYSLLCQSLQLQSAVDSTHLSYCYLIQHNQVIGCTTQDSVKWYQLLTTGSTILLYCHGFDTVTITYPLPDSILLLAPISVSLPPLLVEGCEETKLLGATAGRLQKKIGIQMADLSQHVRLVSPDGLPEGCRLRYTAIFMTQMEGQPRATLRLRVYRVRADTLLPGEDMLPVSLLLPIKSDGNWYEADVSMHHLPFTEPLFVGWEVLEVEECKQPMFGVMWEKVPMVSYSWDRAHQVWRFMGVEQLEGEKYQPNVAIRLTLQCPCEDD